MNYLGNAISLNMFEIESGISVSVEPVTPSNVPRDAVSAIGYQETADAASLSLGWGVKANRVSLKLSEDDALFVFQYSGERLERGSTTLPENAEWNWFRVTYKKNELIQA